MRAGVTAWSAGAGLLLMLQAPVPAASMGSLPTGPSERGNDSEISSSPGLTDMLPARVQLLPDRQFQAVLQQEIAAARSEVVLGFHLFSAEEGRDDRAGAVADLLAETAARGVKVIVVLEIGREVSPITKANRGTARLLRRRGVRVYGDMSGTTVHSNVAVIDRRLVFLGSHHLTQQSLGRYREVSLVVDSSTIATAVLGFIESLDPMVYREP